MEKNKTQIKNKSNSAESVKYTKRFWGGTNTNTKLNKFNFPEYNSRAQQTKIF